MLCKDCGVAERLPQSYIFRCAACQEIWRRRVYRRDIRKRFIVLKVYGGRCVCCGETELAFLQIDHIGGWQKFEAYYIRGYALITKLYKLYMDGQIDTDHYRVLCANCNNAIRYDRMCPHQKTRYKAS